MASGGGWARLLAAYRQDMTAAGQSRETIRTRASYLRRFSETHANPAAVTRGDVSGWLSGQRWTPATLKSGQGALRSFFGWALLVGHVSVDPTAGLRPVRVPERLPRPASDFAANAERTIRDPDRRLMVGLAARCGLRRGEIAAVHTGDLMGSALLVHGKGGKDRLVPLPEELRAAIGARPPGFLFPGRFGGHLHPQTVSDWIRQETGSSPHPLRTRFATRAYNGSHDLFGVQKVLGHSSPETTMVYTKLDTSDLAAVMAAAWGED